MKDRQNPNQEELSLNFSDLVQLIRKEYSNERDNIGYARAAQIVDKAIEPNVKAYAAALVAFTASSTRNTVSARLKQLTEQANKKETV